MGVNYKSIGIWSVEEKHTRRKALCGSSFADRMSWTTSIRGKNDKLKWLIYYVFNLQKVFS